MTLSGQAVDSEIDFEDIRGREPLCSVPLPEQLGDLNSLIYNICESIAPQNDRCVTIQIHPKCFV